MRAPDRTRFDYTKVQRRNAEDWMLEALGRGRPIDGVALGDYVKQVEQIPTPLREHIADRLARPRRGEVGRKGSGMRDETELKAFKRACLVRWYADAVDEYGNSDDAFERLAKILGISVSTARRFWSEASDNAKRSHRALDQDRKLARAIVKVRRRATKP